ncbi:MAG: hypothetical protein PF961_18820 [Planctomycetota bacterium]|jgi:hypothetical protein|nr:hypothetical protein [Planctomycetota bacterium]
MRPGADARPFPAQPPNQDQSPGEGRSSGARSGRAVPESGLAELQSDWDRICQHALDSGPQWAGAITGVRPAALSGDKLRLLVIDDAMDPSQLGPDTPGLALLQRLVSNRIGRPLQVEALHGRGSAASGNADTRNRAYTEAQNHPLVQDILKRFEGEVVAREPRPRADFLAERAAAEGASDVASDVASDTPDDTA